MYTAKSEEIDDNVPSIEMLQHAGRMNDNSNTSTYSRQEFHTLELYILKYFKWCLSHPSVAHFIDYYLYVSLKEDEVPPGLSKWEAIMLENQMKEFTAYFMEVTLRGIKKDSLLTVADMVWVYSWNFSLQLSLVFVS